MALTPYRLSQPLHRPEGTKVVQESLELSNTPSYLDGLPMEYWIVPPRTPLATVTPPLLGSKHLHRSGAAARGTTVQHADGGSALRCVETGAVKFSVNLFKHCVKLV